MKYSRNGFLEETLRMLRSVVRNGKGDATWRCGEAEVDDGSSACSGR